MATVGDQLTEAEAGWTRYDDTNENIAYTGTWKNVVDSTYYNGNRHTSTRIYDDVKFNFTGNKLRIIGAYNSVDSNNVKITIDKEIYNISVYSESLIKQVLVFDIENLSTGEHCVTITNLQDSKYCTIDALDIDETGELKPYAPIVAPTNLTATAGDSQVTLLWTAVEGATSYIVKRSITSGGTYETIASGVTDTSYVDTSVTNGTTYYYVVVAVNADGESKNSNEASATPVDNSKFLLRVTMLDSSERDYQLSTTEIDGFINWYMKHTSTDTTGYMLTKKVGTEVSKEYLTLDKIISFEVIER
ncbi:MAG: hypothetical protein H6Q70_3956 [Firmicutes bacterium]|nr:hypothetical protein [Bacillota bacterium]